MVVGDLQGCLSDDNFNHVDAADFLYQLCLRWEHHGSFNAEWARSRHSPAIELSTLHRYRLEWSN